MMTIASKKSRRIDVRLKQAMEARTLPKDLLVVGPAGTGKTRGILTALHCLLRDYPGLRVLLCRQTRASLTESVLVTYEQEILPADGLDWMAFRVQRRNRQAYSYPNGSSLVVGGLDKPDRILSTSWDIIYINEAIEVEESAWDTLASRLGRPGRDPRFGFLMGDTNPGDPSHWLKTRVEEGRTVLWDTDHIANPALHDGKDWTRSGRRYIRQLDRLRGTRRKRLKEGLWAAGEGQWFSTFGDEHISATAAYDPAYPVHLAVDSGVHTGAVWFQVRQSPGRTMVTVFGDFYAFNKTAFDVAVEILAKGRAMGVNRFDRGTTDPAGKAASAVGPTVIGEYRRVGLNLNYWPSFPGSVIDGLTLIDSFVSIDPVDLLVHPTCTRLIEAFANYKRAKRGGQWIDRPEDPQHPYEELMDSLRGGLQDKFPHGRNARIGRTTSGGPGYSDLTETRYQ